jgi:hypothetical protein
MQSDYHNGDASRVRLAVTVIFRSCSNIRACRNVWSAETPHAQTVSKRIMTIQMDNASRKPQGAPSRTLWEGSGVSYWPGRRTSQFQRENSELTNGDFIEMLKCFTC